MRPTKKLIALFAIITIISFHSSAQSRQIKGVLREEIIVREGKLIVYLPDDIRPGDVISGTVVAEPGGRNEKEKSRNLESLQKYKLKIADNIILLSGLPRQSIKTGQIPLRTNFIILEEKYAAIFTKTIILNSSIADPGPLSTQTHALTEAPFRITGPFDGDASNTKCSIDRIPIEILAESPRQTVCNMPQTTSGSHTLTIVENGQTTKKDISTVNLDLSTGKLNLLKGEKTFVDVSISGLQNLPSDATLTVTNTTTGTVTMVGGETQVIPIPPSAVNQSGTFNKKFDLQSVKTGSFSLNVNLDLPEPGTNSKASNHPAALCNCFINEQSYLLPFQICQTLGGSLELPAINNNQPNQSEPGYNNPPIVLFPPPGAMNQQTGLITLQVNSQSNDLVAVIFSEKGISETQWTPIGTAANMGNTWQLNWTAPIGRDGEHIIRARFAGKNNTVNELLTRTYLQLTPASINPLKGERINLTDSSQQLINANLNVQQKAENLRRILEKLAGLRRKFEDLVQQIDKNKTMAEELVAIDKTLEQIPGIFTDSLKKLIDSIAKLKAALPPKPDPAALQQTADDAAQRAKDCEDRLNKLKQEKENAQKELDALNNEIENLLKQLDALHLGNNWVGGHGYNKDGSFWYGYVGDEKSNTNIQGESNNISNKLKDLKKQQNAAQKRVKALDAEIAEAQEDCDKLNKEKEKAEDAANKGNALAAAETQVDELCRQIKALMDALKKWCAAHPGVCNFNPELSGNPRNAAELEAYLSQLNDIIKKKKQKEADLEKTAEEKSNEAQGVANELNAAEAERKAAADDLAKAQKEAERLRAEREKQLEEERAKKRKQEEEERGKTTAPKPAPTLPQPINPSDKQIKFQALSMLRSLYQEYWIDKGPCDCTTKAIALANNTNTAAADVLGGIAIGVMFGPIESLPGLSLGAKLGIGALKAIGSALYGGESFTDELAKNLFDVIGGEIFPKLLESEITGNAANKFAGKGLEELMKEEGIRSTQWEGETTLRECGKVKGKTTMLFNPNTGWVTLLIKIDNCPLIVIKYKVNKDGVPISKPSVTKVQ